jgi:5-deoxy-D-glucuronate isomerase
MEFTVKEFGWSNDVRLDTLRAQGKRRKTGDVLVFTTNEERAEVYLEDGVLEKVIFYGADGLVIVPSKDVQPIVVGEGNTQREVYHFLKPNPVTTMRLGITVHKGEGTWSSLPHDFELNTEPGFEEVFFYILEGGSKKAIQVGKGVWVDNEPVDSVWPVENETFGTVPMGYHPVVGEPGVNVSYVWAYLAKKPEWEKVK